MFIIGLLMLAACVPSQKEVDERKSNVDETFQTPQGTISIIHRDGYDIVLLDNVTNNSGDDMELIYVDSEEYYEHSCGESEDDFESSMNGSLPKRGEPGYDAMVDDYPNAEKSVFEHNKDLGEGNQGSGEKIIRVKDLANASND